MWDSSTGIIKMTDGTIKPISFENYYSVKKGWKLYWGHHLNLLCWNISGGACAVPPGVENLEEVRKRQEEESHPRQKCYADSTQGGENNVGRGYTLCEGDAGWSEEEYEEHNHHDHGIDLR